MKKSFPVVLNPNGEELFIRLRFVTENEAEAPKVEKAGDIAL